MAKTIIFQKDTEKFLLKNKIKTKFAKNLLESAKENKERNLVEDIQKQGPRLAIGMAFGWGGSPEKYEFWDGIYNRAVRFERDLIQIPK